jgi:ribose-phosphate pyrophosphokinase
MILDLTQGICKNSQYDAWKFPGGEIHVKIKNFDDDGKDSVNIITRLNSSDDIMLLLLVSDTLRKDDAEIRMELFIPYMPYQQADRNFSFGECFSLKTMANLINSMGFNKVKIYHPHSEVSAALINNSVVIENTDYIKQVINKLYADRYKQLNLENQPISYTLSDFYNELIIMSADAGGFKPVFKLCEKINFTGQVESCSKSRNHETGDITTRVPVIDESKIVLIIDDISLGSRTFLNIRKELKNKNVYLAVSHGVFNENVDKLETEFTKVFTTNSIRNESIGDNIEVIKVF